MTTITTPGVYDGIPDAEYHVDPVPAGSLSYSGAKKLLPPSCPAIFKHDRDYGQAPRAEFDFGHVAHRLVLGEGAEFVEVRADDWRTKAAKEAAEAARADGLTPLLTKDIATAKAMAAAVRAHPVAAQLLDPDTGAPEQSLFWEDAESGIWRRCRLDWLRNRTTGRVFGVDYKTTTSAAPSAIPAAVAKYRYDMQADYYLDGMAACGVADDAAFLFIFQEKTAPYLVTVVELDAPTLRIGRGLNRRAIDIYTDCVNTGQWPGYSEDIELIGLPHWETRRHEEYL